MRYLVSGRPSIGGRDSVTRAGRHWTREGTLVEVADSDDDPPADPKPEKGAPLRIGKKSWEALKADKILIQITTEGEAATDDLALREENLALKARVVELETKLGLGGAATQTPLTPTVPHSLPPPESPGHGDDSGKHGGAKGGGASSKR